LEINTVHSELVYFVSSQARVRI